MSEFCQAWDQRENKWFLVSTPSFLTLWSPEVSQTKAIDFPLSYQVAD